MCNISVTQAFGQFFQAIIEKISDSFRQGFHTLRKTNDKNVQLCKTCFQFLSLLVYHDQYQ